MNPSLSEALAERGFDTLTPVQEAVSDPDLVSADLLVSAQTGSGKTIGFGLAIAPTLLGEDVRFGAAEAPSALVVAPTRELAFQVMRELRWLYAKSGAQVVSCVGGMDMRDERRTLERGAHIVVGTPGRLRDHITRGSLDMTGLRAVVLDEADEMLDLGFKEDLEFILGGAPEDRRTLLFSATVPPMIAKLAKQYQRDAHRIDVRGETKQHVDISYQAIRVAAQDQENAIFNLLRFHDDASAIVFANTRAAVNHLMARLSNRGFSVVSLSGELSQSERTNALQAMRDGRAKVCVATDVAARGIDLPNLNLVIHADLPTNTESLLHRSGRTGRAGRKGISAMIVPQRATSKAERLLKWAKITAEWTDAPSADDIRRQDEDRLLTDPAWEEPLTDGEIAFAAKILERQSADVIAAAYLRLYRAHRSEPEELLPPSARPERQERQSFGPSTWFSLSVGRNDRAEPRWLLPLLCRSGGLDKSAIGAIRTQATETYVELSTPSVAQFLGNLGPDGILEDGVKAKQMDRPPSFAKKGPPARKSTSFADAQRKSRKEPSTRPDERAPSAAEAAPGGDHKRPKKAKWSPESKPYSKPNSEKTSRNPNDDRNASKGKHTDKPDGKNGKGHRKSPGKPTSQTADARDSSKRASGGPQGDPSRRNAGKPKAHRKGGSQAPKRSKR